MNYRIQKHSNGGYIVQQSDEIAGRWTQAYKTGVYKCNGSAGSRMRALRAEDDGRPSSLGAMIMRSRVFCDIRGQR